MDNTNYMQGYKYCRNCNNQLDFQYSFCDKCGSQLEIIYPNAIYQQPQLQYNTSNTLQYQPYVNNHQNPISAQITNSQYTRIVGFILCIISLIGCIISVFVPYVSASAFGYSESRSMLDNTSDSYIVLILSTIGLISIICKAPTHGIENIVIGVINALIAVIHLIYLDEQIQEMEYSSLFKIGPAVYILLICGVLTFFGGCTTYAAYYNKKHFGIN